VAPINRVLW